MNPSYPLPQPPREPYRRERDSSWDRETGPPPRDYSGSGGGGGRGYDDRGMGMREREREFPRRELDPEPERWGRFDDYDRKRRRSPSPYSRPLRSRHSPPPSPPHSHTHSHSHSYGHTSGPPDPASLDHLLSFRQFADWFRYTHPETARADEEELRRVKSEFEDGLVEGRERVGMGKRFERYKKEFYSRQLYALYLTHKQSAWFIERYSPLPEYVALRKRINRQGRLPTSEKYVREMREGVHDEVSFEQSGEDKPKSSEPEGLDRALGDRGDKYEDPSDETKIEIKPPGGQVFVKTVPPSTKRVDLENLFTSIPGFQHLALSEPSVKKSFHRVAWAQFADDVDVTEVVKKIDGQKIENFTFHLGVNASSTIGRLRTTPPVANTLERLIIDGEKAKQLALKLEEDLFDPPVTNEEDEDVKPDTDEKEERGSTVVQEKIDRLLDSNGLINEEGLDTASKIRRAKIVLDQWLNYLRLGLSTCYYCVAALSFPEELHRKCIAHVRPHISPDLIVEPMSSEGIEEPPKQDPEIEVEPKREERDDGDDDDKAERRDREEDDKDAGRRESPKKAAGGKKGYQKSVDERWLDSLEGRLKGVLDAEVDVVEYGGRDPEEELRKLCAPLIKQEEPQKYRCKDCNKLFRAPEWVLKHVQAKHPEVYKPRMDEIMTLNNFVLDPHHTPVGPTTPAAVNDEILPPPALPFTQFPFDPSAATNGGAFNPLMLQQQAMMMMQMQQAMMMAAGVPVPPSTRGGQPGGGGGGGLLSRVGDFADPSASGGGGLAVPMGAAGGSEDPRARKGRVSYQDLDQVGEGGDGGLPY